MEVAIKICTYLENNGISCWIAPRNVDAGSNYASQIVSAIKQCELLLMLVTALLKPLLMRRPGMEKLLSLVEKGRVRTIIVRDLSRFARNYLDAGHYLEFVFPAYGVRFISINDQFDSALVGEDTGGLELAIKNLLNQMYSRDISRKIKRAVDSKKLSGEFVYGHAPYGYKKGPVKNTIVVDKEVAPIVRQMFLWAGAGISMTEIARRLNAEGVTTPSVYLAGIRGKYKTNSTWTFESARNILQNRIYTGDTVPFKSHVIRVGSDRVKAVPLEEQLVIPNTHEAIISRESFYEAINAKKASTQDTEPQSGTLCIHHDSAVWLLRTPIGSRQGTE